MHNELKAAKAAKAAIEALSTTPKSAVLVTLRAVNRVAVVNLSSGGSLNEARANVGIALSNLIHDHSPPAPEKIDKANRAVEAWIEGPPEEGRKARVSNMIQTAISYWCTEDIRRSRK